jgi:hypothetical protein
MITHQQSRSNIPLTLSRYVNDTASESDAPHYEDVTASLANRLNYGQGF